MTFYEDANYEGEGFGVYANKSCMEVRKDMACEISSIDNRFNCEIMVYSGSSCTGKGLLVSESIRDMKIVYFNDKMESFADRSYDVEGVKMNSCDDAT